MPEQTRVSDTANIKSDAHGCPGCPHNCTGPAILGSPDVFVNSLPAHRKGDGGIHAACCAANLWTAKDGSGSVFVNGEPAMRKGDPTDHCGGSGEITAGSGNVFTGD